MLPRASMITESTDFRVYLQNEFIRRCRLNSRYSLRAFARQLKLESSALSKILRGRRKVSQKMHDQLGLSLGLSRKEIQAFKSYRTKIPRGLNRGDEKQINDRYVQLAEDAFNIIADWYHHAILEFVRLKSFQPDHRWIARRLGINVHEALAAVERLTRAGLLKIENGKWTVLSQHNTTSNRTLTTSAAKKLQEQILTLAIRAINEVDFERRDHSSVTVAIDSSRIPEAKKKLRAFRRSLCHFLQDSSHLDEVYQFASALFPLTHHETKGEKS